VVERILRKLARSSMNTHVAVPKPKIGFPVSRSWDHVQASSRNATPRMPPDAEKPHSKPHWKRMDRASSWIGLCRAIRDLTIVAVGLRSAIVRRCEEAEKAMRLAA